MRGRTGIPKRHHDPAPSSLILFAILFAGCVAISQAVSASALVRSKTRLPKTAAATAAPVAEAAALIRQQQAQQPEQEPVERADNAEEIVLDEEEDAGAENATTKSPLTGNPQVDYKFDPNLPRELNGFNLSDYPFYNSVPEDIDFKCDGLHDGFYASVQHKCQLYHHCLYGNRYDFLCANYTAFDQKTFICHFVSEVDCVNSPKYYKRNEALYKQDTTTTSSTTTTTTTTAAPPPRDRDRDRDSGGRRGGRRRPRPRRPAFDDDDDYEYEFDEYESYEEPSRRERNRKRRPNRQREKYDDDYEASAPKTKTTPTEEPPLPSKPNKSVFEQPRKAPRIKPPVPLSEKEKYARPGDDAPSEKPPAKTTEEYYDEEEDHAPKKNKKPQPQDAGSYEEEDFRRTPPLGANGRPLRRNRPARRRRPSMRPYYDDDDDYRDDYRPMRKRPYNRRPAYDDDYEDNPPPRSRKPSRPRHREYDDEYDVEETEKRPAKKSTTTTSTTTTSTTTTTTTTTPKPTTKRPKPSTTTLAYEDEEYYEDEFYEDDEPVVKKPQGADAEPEASTTSTTTTSTVTSPTSRRPFVPKPKPPTQPPDTSLKFTLKNPTEAEEEREFSIDDYVKAPTRAPFVPSSRQSHKLAPTTASTPTSQPKTNAYQMVKERIPVEDYEAAVKPQSQISPRVPTKTAEFSSPAQVPSRAPVRGPVKQVATFTSPEAVSKTARFPSRNKPAAVPEITSPGEEEEYHTIRKPEIKHEPTLNFKAPAPPPRTRLSTTFLPRGLSPVGGARNNVRPAPAPAPSLPSYEDEDDEAFNDALHPTGADSSASTVSYVPQQRQSSSRLSPIRGTQQQRLGLENGGAAQSAYSRIPEYDDETAPSAPSAPAGRTSSRQQYQQESPSGFDAFQRQPTSSATSNAYRPQSRQSAPRGNRPLAAAASSTQYQGWSRDYYFPTY